jgi:hypothetical protein
MRRSSRGILALTCSLWLSCAPLSAVQRASTLGAGKTQLSFEASAYSGIAPSTPPKRWEFLPPKTNATLPSAAVAFRGGVMDSFDLGLRLSMEVAELQTKLLLVELTDPNLVVSIAPALSAPMPMGYAHSVNLAVPMLFGFRQAGDHELVIGTRFQAAFDVRSPAADAALGASLGYARRVSKELTLMPEVAVFVPFPAANPSVSGAFIGGNDVAVQFVLGILGGEPAR